MAVMALATDSSGQIYAAGSISSQFEILVYAAGASGSATPLRTIVENATNVVIPNSIAVDSAGAVYVLGQSSLGVFAANANGTSSPVRLIQGALTQLNSPNEVTVDGTGNIYVTTSVSSVNSSTGAILIFASGATGNAAPARVITATPVFTGIAVDSASNIYTVEDTVTFNPITGAFSTTAAALVEFSAGASGAATPTRSVSGSATGLTFAGGLSRDNAGNVYIVNVFIPTTGSPTFNVLEFGPNATGNVGPGINFNSSAWTDPGEQIALR
jgi:sugar lactone lactonase YvrE